MPPGKYIRTEEMRAKISAAGKGKHRSQEIRLKMSSSRMGNKNPFYGKQHSDETRTRIGNALKGIKNHNYGKHFSEETCRKISEGKKGTVVSAETRRKISESEKGDKNPFYGRHHSEESCKKNSESHLGKGVGSDNPFYGKRHSDESRRKNSDAHKGELSPRWLGGKSFEPYTPEWRKELKELVRDRDGHKCCICSVPQNGKKHPVHHVDYDKKNCDPVNLVTLCLSCHTKTNSKRNYWTQYFQSLTGHIATNMSSCIGSNVDNVELQMN